MAFGARYKGERFRVREVSQQTKVGSGGGVQIASQDEGITTFASTPETVLSSELFAGSHTEQVEPRITLNTGGAQAGGVCFTSH